MPTTPSRLMVAAKPVDAISAVRIRCFMGTSAKRGVRFEVETVASRVTKYNTILDCDNGAAAAVSGFPGSAAKCLFQYAAANFGGHFRNSHARGTQGLPLPPAVALPVPDPVRRLPLRSRFRGQTAGQGFLRPIPVRAC